MTTRQTLLLTGASGFIGKALLGMLREPPYRDRYRVVALSAAALADCETIVVPRDTQGRQSPSLADFGDAGIDRIDHVIHAGAFTPKSGADADNIDGCAANVANTHALVRALPVPVSRIVFLSTLDVYGPVDGAISEACSPAPTTLYGKSKLFCEAMLQALQREPDFAETIVQILRVGHIYGAGEEAYRKFLPVSIARLKRGEPPMLATVGTEQRAFLHIDDCCRLILAALDTPPLDGPVNIASDRPRSIGDLAVLLCDIAREEGGIDVAPIYGDGPIGPSIVFDVARMHRLLGREQVAIGDGLRDEFRRFREDAA